MQPGGDRLPKPVQVVRDSLPVLFVMVRGSLDREGDRHPLRRHVAHQVDHAGEPLVPPGSAREQDMPEAVLGALLVGTGRRDRVRDDPGVPEPALPERSDHRDRGPQHGYSGVGNSEAPEIGHLPGRRSQPVEIEEHLSRRDLSLRGEVEKDHVRPARGGDEDPSAPPEKPTVEDERLQAPEAPGEKRDDLAPRPLRPGQARPLPAVHAERDLPAAAGAAEAQQEAAAMPGLPFERRLDDLDVHGETLHRRRHGLTRSRTRGSRRSCRPPFRPRKGSAQRSWHGMLPDHRGVAVSRRRSSPCPFPQGAPCRPSPPPAAP